MLRSIHFRASRHAPAICLTALLVAAPIGCGTTPVATPARAAPPASPSAEAKAARPVGVATAVTDPSLAAAFTNLSQDGDIYFAGWPTEAGLRALAARGVRTVITLKTVDEITAARGFDARAVAQSLGIELVVIPVRPNSFSAADVTAFAAAFDAARGPVLIHCGSSNTVGGMWAAYLANQRGLAPADALSRGRAAGLRDGPMADATQRVISGAAATPAP
jgi:uncharacterized protein (TIGR01244 family)